MILKVFSSLNDSTILFPFENSSVLSMIAWTFQPTWKRQTPSQEGDSGFKIPDSNLPHLMMHRLHLQLKGSDLQLKHKSSDHTKICQPSPKQSSFYFFFTGNIHCIYGMKRSTGPSKITCYHSTVSGRRTLPSPEIQQSGERSPFCLEMDSQRTD